MNPITLTPAGTILETSELVINPDGSIYHLALRPEQLGDLVLVVGDPGRVEQVSRHFEQIEHRTANREFIAHTGQLRGTHITVLSTGIGTDNIDIVVSELDALANIDLQTRMPNREHRSLRIVRLGTCGALQEDIPVDAHVVTAYGVGLDNVLHYYACEPTDREMRILQEILAVTEWPDNLPIPYVAEGDRRLTELLGNGNTVGMTLTACGFYGPQGRQLRLVPSVDGLNERFNAFSYEGMRIINYEMETSALYGLGGMLGHRTCSVCLVVANRMRREYRKDHQGGMDAMIAQVLERLTDR